MPAPRYDVFISYSHLATPLLAKELQTALQRYATPWWRRRSLVVFRDETDLTLSPEAWQSLSDALDASEWFVLLASQNAATSKWVQRELRHWLRPNAPREETLEKVGPPILDSDSRRRERMLVVVVDGTIEWRDADGSRPGDFDWSRTNALPASLAGVFRNEPLWVDLRHLSVGDYGSKRFDRRNSIFLHAVAQLTARIRDIELSALIGEDARLHRWALRTAWGAAASLLFLTISLGIVAVIAVIAARTATDQRDNAWRNQSQIIASKAEDFLLTGQPRRAWLALAQVLDWPGMPAYATRPLAPGVAETATQVEVNATEVPQLILDTSRPLSVCSTNRFMAGVTEQHDIAIWDLGSVDPTPSLIAPVSRDTQTLVFTNDCSALLAQSRDGQITIWDPLDRSGPTRALPGAYERLFGARRNQNNSSGLLLFTSTSDGVGIVWSTSDQKEKLAELPIGSQGNQSTIVDPALGPNIDFRLSPDGRYVLRSGPTSPTVLWDFQHQTSRTIEPRLPPALCLVDQI
jgi:TIR domain